MALTTTTNKVIHNGNASATSFAYTFPILEASHLTVIYTDADDVETTLSASEYSVTGIGGRSGGSVTYPLTGSPIATGTKLTIVRTVPYTQTTVLSNQGGYYPEVVESRLDQIYMAMQQLAEIVGRTSTFSISDPATEQSNYALIQALQADLGDFDKLTTAGDILSHSGTAYIRLPRGDSDQYLGVTGTALEWKDLIIDLATSQVTGVLPSANGGFVQPKGYAARTASGATLSSSFSSPMTISEGIELFSTSYAASVSGRTVVIEVDVADVSGQTASASVGIFINGATNAVMQSDMQFSNSATHAGPARCVYFFTAPAGATAVAVRMAGNVTIGPQTLIIRELAP